MAQTTAYANALATAEEVSKDKGDIQASKGKGKESKKEQEDDDSEEWTKEDDEKILDWKRNQSGKPWARFADEIGKSVQQCKDRWVKIKPEDWVEPTNTKNKGGKGSEGAQNQGKKDKKKGEQKKGETPAASAGGDNASGDNDAMGGLGEILGAHNQFLTPTKLTKIQVPLLLGTNRTMKSLPIKRTSGVVMAGAIRTLRVTRRRRTKTIILGLLKTPIIRATQMTMINPAKKKLGIAEMEGEETGTILATKKSQTPTMHLGVVEAGAIRPVTPRTMQKLTTGPACQQKTRKITTALQRGIIQLKSHPQPKLIPRKAPSTALQNLAPLIAVIPTARRPALKNLTQSS